MDIKLWDIQGMTKESLIICGAAFLFYLIPATIIRFTIKDFSNKMDWDSTFAAISYGFLMIMAGIYMFNDPITVAFNYYHLANGTERAIFYKIMDNFAGYVWIGMGTFIITSPIWLIWREKLLKGKNNES